MQKLRKPLFISLIVILLFLLGGAIYLFVITRPSVDHAVPYRNAQLPGPAGFSWKDYSPKGFKFLVPDNWFVDENMDNKEEYLISKVSWEETPLFITGMVLDVTRNMDLPDIQARDAIENLIAADLTQKILMKNVRREGKATIRDIQVLSIDQSFPDKDVRQHKEIYYRFIARPDLHILYMVRFETPANQWDADWAQGKVLLDNLTFEN